jgi:uncharacterized protein YegP (UPF0339 family)
MAGEAHYELLTGTDPTRYGFRVRAANGEVVGGGEAYTRKADARRGIKDHATAVLAACGADTSAAGDAKIVEVDL